MYTALAPAYEEAQNSISQIVSNLLFSQERVKGGSFCTEESWKTQLPTPLGASNKQTGMQKTNDALSLQRKLQHPTTRLTSDSTARPRACQGPPGPHY